MYESGWRRMDEVIKDGDTEDIDHKSIGYLVSDTTRCLVIVQSFRCGNLSEETDRHVGGVIQIPKAAINRIKRLM